MSMASRKWFVCIILANQSNSLQLAMGFKKKADSRLGEKKKPKYSTGRPEARAANTQEIITINSIREKGTGL
jgi:hypothetical protein